MTPTDMGPTHVPTSRRRRTLVMVPASAESVPPRARQAEPHQQTYGQQTYQQQTYEQQAYEQQAYERQPYEQQAYERQPYDRQAQQQQTYQPQPFRQQPQPTQPSQQTYQQPRQPQPPDPPIYRALVHHWADRGRTLPGRHDPEWVRLVAPPVARSQFSASRDPRGDGR
ncbi:hypothetical protein ABZ791_24675 [Streptomyces huasconensis]|uniref:Uncharacterized protein n=1 Tax=Streptomyces huasconensis TaxID=1854574 RepID=A0ABV3LVE0_9ACTN